MKTRHILRTALASIGVALSSMAFAADTPPPEEKGALVSEVRAQCDDGKTAILQSTYVKGRIMTITVASGNKYSLGAIGDFTVIRAFQAAGSATEEQFADSNAWLERIKSESPNYYARAKGLTTDCRVIPSK